MTEVVEGMIIMTISELYSNFRTHSKALLYIIPMEMKVPIPLVETRISGIY